MGGRCDPPPICALCGRAPRVAACSLRQQLHPFSPKKGNATAATTSPRRSLMMVAMPMVLPSWTTTFLLQNSVPVWLWRGWCEGLRIAVAANGGVTRDAAVGGQYLWETEGPTLECSSHVGGRGQPSKGAMWAKACQRAGLCGSAGRSRDRYDLALVVGSNQPSARTCPGCKRYVRAGLQVSLTF